MSRVVAYVPDLMDRSRLGGVAGLVFVATPEDLVAAAATAEVVVVDLSRPGVLDVLGRLGPVRTVGFASHVDTDLLAAATRAGCGEVLPRSRFFARPGELLAAEGPRGL
ncbi:MAG: hypothetical protein ACRDZW_00045 [Acidimicrobiales bacterium]